MSAQDPKNTRRSKIYFALIIAVILGGTAFWVFLTMWAAEPLGPTIAKEFAEDFERECFLETQDQTRCRKVVGRNHRDCLFANIQKVAPGTGDNGGDVEHDRAGYMSCMREKTGISH
jgi:hypothetical protein